MKALLVITGVVATGMAVGFLATQSKSPKAAPAQTELSTSAVRQPESEVRMETAPPPVSSARMAFRKTTEAMAPASADPGSNAPARNIPGQLAINQALQSLLSPESSFQQKQAAWGQLRDSGKLDQAMTELEQQTAGNPNAPQYPATLGQAYLQKAGTIQDIREQGILGMKADQSFDLALKLDPQNWEARFWKATAMSYWPAQLGKGKEVIEHCLELLRFQEVQAPRPEFAQVYVLLGEQYVREGYNDYAKEAWQRGSTLFPAHPELAEKVAAAQ